MLSKLKTVYLPDTIFVSIVTLLVVVISIVNYKPGTWLTGWDNLHPEMDFGLNIDRSINGVWQEYQGVGLLSGMAHTADLPRQLILLLFSLVLPLSFLRYLYFYLMLWSGPIGLYFFARWLLKRVDNSWEASLAAFLGSLFYLLNIGTVLNFYAPISFFNTQYGFLPWLLLYFYKYIREQKRAYLIVYFALSFFASQMAYVPTLFIVYIGILILISIYEFIVSKFNSKLVRNLFVIAFITLLANLYWILPFSLFAFKGSSTVINSKISQMSSENTFVLNKRGGSFFNTVLLKGFWLSNTDMNENREFVPMFKEWNDHLSNKYILFVGYTLSVFLVLGVIYSLYRGRSEIRVFLLLFLVSMLMLMSENPPFGWIYALIREHSSIFREIFRFTYTKFSLMAVFSYALMFSFGIKLVIDLIRKFTASAKLIKVMQGAFATILIASMITWIFPIFQGYLFYPRLRLNIPQSYFNTFDFFKDQSASTRIAVLPQHTFWSWKYYNWGYRGSGFLWYGIKQPILDRAFDVWTPYNEGYYYEISQAIYSKDKLSFDNTIDKYAIDWLLLDKNMISTSGDQALAYDIIDSFVLDTQRYSLVRKYGDIEIYRVNRANAGGLFVAQLNNINTVSRSSLYTDKDNIYNTFGSYIVSENAANEIPFISLNHDKSVNVSNLELLNEYELSKPLSIESKPVYLLYPSYSDSENYISAKVFVRRVTSGLQVRLEYLLPKIQVEGIEIVSDVKELLINIPTYSYKSNVLGFNSKDFIDITGLDGIFKDYGHVVLRTKDNSIELLTNTSTINLSALLQGKNAIKCSDDYEDSLLSTNYFQDGQISLKAKNVSGCLNADINPLVGPKTKIINVSFDYKSYADEKPGYCLYNALSTVCLNVKNNGYGFSYDWKNVNEYIDITTKGPWKIDFSLILEGFKSGKEKDISYRNANLKLYENSYASNFSVVLPEKSVLLDKIPAESEIKAYLPYVENLYTSRNIGPAYSYYNSIVGNCRADFSGASSYEILDDSGIKYIRYRAKNSDTCDYYGLTRFSHDASYIVSIKSRNVAGVPLEFCFANPTRYRCILDSYLSKSREWQTTYEFVRSSEIGSRTYSVGIHNIALGYDSVINDMAYINVNMFPVEWLTEIMLTTSKDVSKAASVVIPYKRLSTWLYRINSFSTSKPLVLNQGYNTGWLAVCSFKLCNARHVLVSNWANGWIFNNYENNRNIGTIYLIFWPQLLEYLGFAVLIATLLGLIWPKKRLSST